MAGGDFLQETIRALAKRAGERCSKCKNGTSLPNSDPKKFTNLGEGAHIRGNREAPSNRFDASMSDAERADISNGIWLCNTCHKIVDSDAIKYPVDFLINLKQSHERLVEEKYFDKAFPDYTNEKMREHDSTIFKQAEEIFSESMLRGLLEHLKKEKFIYLGNKLYVHLNDYKDFHSLVGNEYLNKNLIDSWHEFHYRLSALLMLLFEHMNDGKGEEPGISLPHIGLKPYRTSLITLIFDRNNPTSKKIFRKIAYDRKLKELIDNALDGFVKYRRAIKETLFI